MSATCPEMGPVGSYIYQQDFHSNAANHLSQHLGGRHAHIHRRHPDELASIFILMLPEEDTETQRG